MKYIIGIDIGGTKSAIVLGNASVPEYNTANAPHNERVCSSIPDNASVPQFDMANAPGGGPDGGAPGAGVIIDKKTFATEGPERTAQFFFESIGELTARHGVKAGELRGIGISCGGPLDSKLGIIKSPPNLCGWDDVPIVKLIEGRYGVKTRLENDANACALAEWRYGAGRGSRNMVFMTFGTGLGAGLILNGELYGGTNGMAGEVGHIRLSGHGPVGYGKSGSFEGFCSGGGIAQLAAQMARERIQMGEKPAYCPTVAELGNITAKSVAEHAFGGDPLARSVYETSGAYLGRGLAVVIDVLNPEAVVIGSIFKRCEALLRGSMEAELAKEGLAQSVRACRVVPAALGDDIGDYAALSLA